MKNKTSTFALVVPALVLASVLVLQGCGPKPAEAPVQPKAALAVTLISPTIQRWEQTVSASGNVAPWQESSVGTEVGGLRISQVLVNVGDKVRKGQVLARLNPASVQTDRMAGAASVAEAEANLAQAQLNAERSSRLSPTGALSKQDIVQYETQRKTAEAKLKAAQAQLAAQDLRLANTSLLAPDDGVISARTATEGAVVPVGSELFRLIRQGRLEWRAEVKGETLLQLKSGQPVRVAHPLGTPVAGQVRQVSATVDVNTRNGIAYVDLPASANLKAGMYVSGTFKLAETPALSLPQAALFSRDGYTYALKVDAQSRVQAVKVTTGRLNDQAVEIVEGLSAQDRVIEKGVGFLKTGDLVKVVTSDSQVSSSAAAAAR